MEKLKKIDHVEIPQVHHLSEPYYISPFLLNGLQFMGRGPEQGVYLRFFGGDNLGHVFV